MLNLEEVKKILANKFQNSEIIIEDTKGDGKHFEIVIISDLFEDKSLIKRQQMVYETLGSIVGKEMHALSLETKTFKEGKGISSLESTTKNNNANKNLETDILQKIDKVIKENDIVLFMKGFKDMPMCGFSSIASQILMSFDIDFLDINVLDSEQVRENIKVYSNWPTIPQIYIKGEFIGGCDILREMYENGKLKELLQKHNLIK